MKVVTMLISDSEDSRVILGFPGVGKTVAEENFEGVIDLESSSFKYIETFKTSEEGKGNPNRTLDPNYPKNYIQAIQAAMSTHKVVLASMHPEVRDGLRLLGVEYWVCFPSHDCKEEYMARYRDRGNSEYFLKSMEEFFYESIRRLDGYDRRVELTHGETLSDYLLKALPYLVPK